MLRGNSTNWMLKQMTTSLAGQLNLLSLRPPSTTWAWCKHEFDAKQTLVVDANAMSNKKLWGLMWWLAICNFATTTITAQPRSTSKCKLKERSDFFGTCVIQERCANNDDVEFTYNYVLSTLPPIWCVLQLIMLQLTSQPEWCSMLIDMATSAFNTFEWKANSPVWRCWRGT